MLTILSITVYIQKKTFIALHTTYTDEQMGKWMGKWIDGKMGGWMKQCMVLYDCPLSLTFEILILGFPMIYHDFKNEALNLPLYIHILEFLIKGANKLNSG